MDELRVLHFLSSPHSYFLDRHVDSVGSALPLRRRVSLSPGKPADKPVAGAGV